MSVLRNMQPSPSALPQQNMQTTENLDTREREKVPQIKNTELITQQDHNHTSGSERSPLSTIASGGGATDTDQRLLLAGCGLIGEVSSMSAPPTPRFLLWKLSDAEDCAFSCETSFFVACSRREEKKAADLLRSFFLSFSSGENIEVCLSCVVDALKYTYIWC